ncbi:MAG: glycine zipper family protein [Aquificae bacterium]|nr:glycine zipper family protein [Aquificota bacterium]
MKKIIISIIAIFSILSSKSFALDGEIIFKDALYGAAVGGLAGGALYLADSDNFGTKVGIGIFIGLVAGAAIGVYESQAALVQLDSKEIKLALPQIEIEKNQLNTITKVYLFEAKF